MPTTWTVTSSCWARSISSNRTPSLSRLRVLSRLASLSARLFMEIYIKAFPDLHFTIDQMITSGDYVVTR